MGLPHAILQAMQMYLRSLSMHVFLFVPESYAFNRLKKLVCATQLPQAPIKAFSDGSRSRREPMHPALHAQEVLSLSLPRTALNFVLHLRVQEVLRCSAGKVLPCQPACSDSVDTQILVVAPSQDPAWHPAGCPAPL